MMSGQIKVPASKTASLQTKLTCGIYN